LTRVNELRQESAKLDEQSVGLLFHHLSESRLVTIAQIEGRVRGIGSEFVLACDMRFAARESAVFGQFEPSFGVIPGTGGVQHLTRLMGRARALEVMLSAEDYNADVAERYGWINRVLPARELSEFVSSLALRIASFPAAGHIAIKDRVNAIALAPAEEFRRDSGVFGAGLRNPEAQGLIQAAFKRGLQTRDAEMDLASMLANSAPSQDRPQQLRIQILKGGWRMEDNTLVQSSFSATINAPIETVDIPAWCFTLPESEYQSCSPAHYSAGSTTAPDGRRMSINVEVLGGSMIVQHYVEEIGQPDHLRLVSTSDVFTPTGRTKIGVIRDLVARKIDDKTCEFTNTVQSYSTPELLDFLGQQGIPLEVFRGARKPVSEAHNRQETPMFAKSIERHALRQRRD